jgi:hypothetical protein
MIIRLSDFGLNCQSPASAEGCVANGAIDKMTQPRLEAAARDLDLVSVLSGFLHPLELGLDFSQRSSSSTQDVNQR